MDKKRVDLQILKRLVAELESSLTAAEDLPSDPGGDRVNYLVELSKATGLAAGILTEAGLLVGDIQFLIQNTATQPAAGSSALLGKILGGLKGPVGSN